MYPGKLRSLQRAKARSVRTGKVAPGAVKSFRHLNRSPNSNPDVATSSGWTKCPNPSQESPNFGLSQGENPDMCPDTNHEATKQTRDEPHHTLGNLYGPKTENINASPVTPHVFSAVYLTSQGLQVGTGSILASGIWSNGQTKIKEDGIEIGEGSIKDGVIQNLTLDHSVKALSSTSSGAKSQEITSNQVEYGGNLVSEGIAIVPTLIQSLGRSVLSLQYVRGPMIGINVLIPDMSNATGVFVSGMTPISPKYITGQMKILNPGWTSKEPKSGSGLLWGMYRASDQSLGTPPFWIGYFDCTVWTNSDYLVLTYVERLLTNIQHNTRWSHFSIE